MINRNNIDIVDILLIATGILFLFELIFFDAMLLFFIVFYSALIYFGKEAYYSPRGKVMFWLGIFLLLITILNTLTFKFLLVTIVIYYISKWYKSKQEPDYYKPQFLEDEQKEETTQNKKVLFMNKLFGRQRTKKYAYEWQDINIQAGVGDTVIDLNYTVLPKGESVIVIRNIVGNVQIIIPYDVEVSINHSVLLGSVDILDHQEANVWNRVIHLQTADYVMSNQKVKIFTSMVAGKLEVKRG